MLLEIRLMVSHSWEGKQRPLGMLVTVSWYWVSENPLISILIHFSRCILHFKKKCVCFFLRNFHLMTLLQPLEKGRNLVGYRDHNFPF